MLSPPSVSPEVQTIIYRQRDTAAPVYASPPDPCGSVCVPLSGILGLPQFRVCVCILPPVCRLSFSGVRALVSADPLQSWPAGGRQGVCVYAPEGPRRGGGGTWLRVWHGTWPANLLTQEETGQSISYTGVDVDMSQERTLVRRSGHGGRRGGPGEPRACGNAGDLGRAG